MMTIQIGGLSEGIHEYHFRADAAEMGLEKQFAGDVVVSAVLEKNGSQLFLKAAIQTTGTFSCDRCLVEFTSPMNPTYHMYYVTHREDADRFDPAEVAVLGTADHSITLDDDVRQVIMLSVPLKLLCRTDCAGLCPECGRNRNEGACSCDTTVTDNRWEALRRLLDN